MRVDERALVTLLVDITRTMLTDRPMQDVLDQVVAQVVAVLPVTGVGITLLAADATAEYVAASDPMALALEQVQIELQEGPSLAAHRSDEPVAVPDLAADTAFPLFLRALELHGMAAVFGFPLHHGDVRLGALDLYRDAPGDLDVEERQVAQNLADAVAACLLNAQWRARARQDVDWFRRRALHDPLTGLANRVLLQDRLTHAGKRAPRGHVIYAVLFADLDHFKQVNDRHGHAVGDELLVAVAERLNDLVRPGDTLARIGGDEFVLLCEDLNGTDEIEGIARRVRLAFATPFPLDGLELSITASIGIASAAPGQVLASQLLAQADRTMYREKAERRGANVPVQGHGPRRRRTVAAGLTPTMRQTAAGSTTESA